MSSDTTPLYRERLWPGPGTFLAITLIIPAALLVFLPISVAAGIGIAAGLYAIALGFLLLSAPLVEVTADELRAGPARLPRTAVGAAQAFEGEEARAERGTRLDARAWLLLRGWAPGVVRVELDDPEDPTPYWLISTRRPTALAAALSA